MNEFGHLHLLEKIPPAQVYLIAGPTAAGKSTFSSILADYLNALVLAMDDYFLDENQAPIEYDEKYGQALQWESPEAYDIPLLLSSIHQLLTESRTVVPIYSFSTNRRVGYRNIYSIPGQPIIVEGMYAMLCKAQIGHNNISTFGIFMTADVNIRRARVRIRDSEERGKPDELFEKRFHFMRIGEERWLLKQATEVDFILDTTDGFSSISEI